MPRPKKDLPITIPTNLEGMTIAEFKQTLELVTELRNRMLAIASTFAVTPVQSISALPTYRQSSLPLTSQPVNSQPTTGEEDPFAMDLIVRPMDPLESESAAMGLPSLGTALPATPIPLELSNPNPAALSILEPASQQEDLLRQIQVNKAKLEGNPT